MATAIDPRQRFQRAQAAKDDRPASRMAELKPRRRSPPALPPVPVLCAQCRGQVDDRLALTQRQAQVLAFLRDYITAHGYAPTLREIGAAFGGMSECTAHGHVRTLDAKGYIRQQRGQPRAITLCD
jgi:hypothetical protein